MQVLDTPEPLRNLADLIAAQLEFHKKAYEILSELAPVVDGLQIEQEVSPSLPNARNDQLIFLSTGQLSQEPGRGLRSIQGRYFLFSMFTVHWLHHGECSAGVLGPAP